MPALTVHNAEVKTATVEVQTLTISGKQVTLAVFRQLLLASWYRWDEPRGPGWGTVNYHPGKCANDDPHLHVVWQLGTELRRDKVFAVHKYGHDRIGRVDVAREEANITRCPSFLRMVDVDQEGTARFRNQNGIFGPRLGDVQVWVPRSVYSWGSEHRCSERCATNLETALRRWASVIRSNIGAESRWEAALQLPQLFIAV